MTFPREGIVRFAHAHSPDPSLRGHLLLKGDEWQKATWLEPFHLGINLASMTLTLADEPALAGIPADELRMDLACGMYREGKITAVTAAHLAGVGIVRFQEELRNRSIPRAYDTEDLESDLAFLRSPIAA